MLAPGDTTPGGQINVLCATFKRVKCNAPDRSVAHYVYTVLYMEVVARFIMYILIIR